jgi:large subunit ribosomal protein L9e
VGTSEKGWIFSETQPFFHFVQSSGMKDIYKDEEFDIPDGVAVNIKSRLITVEGPRGKLTKSLRHIDMEIKKIGDKKIKLVVWHGARKHVACLRTVRSLITNMMNGVTKVYMNTPLQVSV